MSTFCGPCGCAVAETLVRAFFLVLHSSTFSLSSQVVLVLGAHGVRVSRQHYKIANWIGLFRRLGRQSAECR